MVIIGHDSPQILNAYSTVPLTQSIIETTQHGFYDGGVARFGNPQVVVAIHNRTELHGLSHYDLRIALDAEGALDPFVVLDDHTPQLNAVWYVETTAQCQRWDSFFTGMITYPYENFTTWQIHIRVPDLPITQVAWSVGAGSLPESVPSPYDPHDPQWNIFHYTTGQGPLNWTDPNQILWGDNAWVRANYSEVMLSSDPDLTKYLVPRPRLPFVISLTKESARKNGLLPYWNFPVAVTPPGGEVELSAKYDWDDPRWPKGYPDDPEVVSRLTPTQRVQHADKSPFSRMDQRPQIVPETGNGTQTKLVGPNGEAEVVVSGAVQGA
ncbi:MAG: hypothetical protein Q9209_006606 [Squamulea sp. 1 TL-2023]